MSVAGDDVVLANDNIGPTERSDLSRFRLFSVADLENLPDAKWLVEGILPENGLTVLYGSPGSFKTFLALGWALSASSGSSWHGRAVTKGNVVYVYAEGAKGILPRVRAWQKIYGGAAENFRTLPQGLDMGSRNDVSALIASVRQSVPDPVLLVVDTLARCFGDGDENSQKDMNAFVRGCDMVRAAFPRCTVLIIHHAGKDSAKKDRGSTVLRGAADTMMSVKRNGDTITLSCEKQKDAEEFHLIKFALQCVPVNDNITSCALELSNTNASEPSVDPRAALNDNRALAALANMGEAGANYSAWLNASGLAESTFKAALKRLKNAQRVVHDGSVYRIVQ